VALFEWDPAKERSNVRKHGISFEIAQNVFDRPDAEQQEFATTKLSALFLRDA
jgi:uncharacterized DUF497 family protein